ncbi:MAG: AhpC/TSA family protein [Tannerellaceae bacterium]|jgi:peroxiredoxin|nr:AhpC/TSA family protein [Tannerellaceae bacterium]
MKRIKWLFAGILGILCLAGCGNNREPNLSGTVASATAGKIYLQRYDNKSFFTIDSAEISNGAFQFSGLTTLPEIYGLSLDNSSNPTHSYLLFLGKEPVRIEFDTVQRYKNTKVTGSAEQDLYEKLLKQLKTPLRDILEEHPSSLAALYVFYRYYSYRLSPEEIRQHIELLDTTLQNTTYAELLKAVAANDDNVAIGKKAPDFRALDTEGKEVRLSDYLGKGHVLIDFWASWCGPCRRESPSLVKLYEKYKGRGLEIVGLSLDLSVDAWKKAIHDDHFTWPQLIDTGAWAGEGLSAYNVRVIPNNYLINKEGIIVAKSLRSDDLDQLIETFCKE